MVQKNLLALISITNCSLKRFQTENNTCSLKRFFKDIIKIVQANSTRTLEGRKTARFCRLSKVGEMKVVSNHRIKFSIKTQIDLCFETTQTKKTQLFLGSNVCPQTSDK